MANFGPGFTRVMGALYLRLERLAARWTDAFVVNGIELRDRYVHAGVAAMDRFILVRSAVDVEAFHDAADAGTRAARASLNFPPDHPIVLFAGSIDHRKGAHHLPRFFDELRSQVPDAVLLVAGRGPLEEGIRAEMRRRGVENAVRWLGFTDRLPEVMTAADCLIMLSNAEGLATVLLHAAASGTPFVSYDVDGPAEIIGLGAKGAVAPLGNLDQAVRLTVAMIRGGRGSPLALDEWGPDEVRRRYREVFRGLLEHGSAL
jgi:glycosyltransferase involved in cell wall biosynthesis